MLYVIEIYNPSTASNPAAGPQVYPFLWLYVCVCVAVANFYKWKIPTTLLLQLQAIYTRAKNEAKHVLLKEKKIQEKINMLRTCVWVQQCEWCRRLQVCVRLCVCVCVCEPTNTKMHVKMWRKMVGTHKHSCRIDICGLSPSKPSSLSIYHINQLVFQSEQWSFLARKFA